MTAMSDYLAKLATWHRQEQAAAADRGKRATTRDCILSNQRSIHRHQTAADTLHRLAEAFRKIESAGDFIQGE